MQRGASEDAPLRGTLVCRRLPVKLQLRSVVLGFAFACVLFAGALGALFFAGGGWKHRQPFHAAPLSSGRTEPVTALYLAWGGGADDDHTLPGNMFTLEFVSSNPGAEPAARKQEALEVFELARPLSEQLGLKGASVCAFPALERKGRFGARQK